MNRPRDSFVELNARERAKAILDEGTFLELLGPFEGFESPHLAPQSIVPQSDDGVVIAKGRLDGKTAVVISIEGAFQGGGIGEVSGAKIAGALELAAEDNKRGVKTYAVVLFDSGGVRLQEANYGLLAISEIQSAVVELRSFVPVVGVIPGKVGCFGGMSITAGLFSTLIITREGRLTLNGPEVIEQEAGIAELDSRDKALIWSTIGGAQRQAAGFADVLTEDEIKAVAGAVRDAIRAGEKEPRSGKVDWYLSHLKEINPAEPLTPGELVKRWQSGEPPVSDFTVCKEEEEGETQSRGRTWFKALTGKDRSDKCGIPSVLCADGVLEGEAVRYIAVVPNPSGRFYRARKGEVGLEEGWMLAKCVREAVEEDRHSSCQRPIVAIVDVPSQAYGYKEELLGIHQALAGAVDAYATARLAGHPVIALLVGPSISGGFLAHGYQSNRIIALDDPKVLVHAMSKQSAARITKRSIEEMEAAAKKVPAMAYDLRSYEMLGALEEVIGGVRGDCPQQQDIRRVSESLAAAIRLARNAPRDLRNRLTSEKALTGREATIKVRQRLREEWN